MTGAEWLKCEDPGAMFVALGKKATDRKCRLFAVACCYAQPLTGRSRKHPKHLVKMWVAAEKFADGAVSLAEVRRAWLGATSTRSTTLSWPERPHAWAREWAGEDEDEDAELAPAHARVALLREIFGNPFRRAAIKPAWLTSTVVALAQGIYEEQAFDRMPYLADALQDAGCEDATILNHCREEAGTHVRGCWVIDRILGKE